MSLSRSRIAAVTWRDYHDSTKHSVDSLKRRAPGLDWANMPYPFRHYEGVPVLDLPADPPPPEIPAFQVLAGASGNSPVSDGATFLSQLLFYSASISASKRVPSTGYRYALRVNPSSGNLHPTEFHFFTQGLKDWPDGLYHYRPSSHMAEQRALGHWSAALTGISAPLVFVLTSIPWREEWKYGDRAYRYCLHDIGHAWQALSLVARAVGCETFAIGCFNDDEVREACRPNDDEWPMLVMTCRGSSIPTGEQERREPVWFSGDPNRLSENIVEYPLIEAMHHATKLNRGQGTDVSAPEESPRPAGAIKLTAPATSTRSFAETVRMRRSALDFVGGARSISFAHLSALLHATAQPLSSDFSDVPFIQLYLYIHRVDGLSPGVYHFSPSRAELEMYMEGDQRVAAAGLSLGQQLAGNACVAFSMIGNLDRAARLYGDRGYRYVHFEAGAIGHRLYLAAESLGLAATGIGAFYDDEVHHYLNLQPDQGQVVYHFAIGYPVLDTRLSG